MIPLGVSQAVGAAKAFNLHPATIWSYLNRLEQELADRLVERSGLRRRTSTPTTFVRTGIDATRQLAKAINTAEDNATLLRQSTADIGLRQGQRPRHGVPAR
ncbi:LysR family transcriptional regulator [Streptomyces sp. NPDC005917]|uniref:helix-turn-helix domain-containing protein n=1 Tax=unclassified Streptomyces TaxID=2593676 RepID=UPI0033D39295